MGAGERLDQLADPHDLLGVEADRRLVEDEHLGIRDQRLGEPDALPVPLRQPRDQPVPHVGDLAALQHLADPAAPLAPADALHVRDEVEVRGDRHVAVERDVLGQVADPAPHLERLLEHVEAGHPGGPARGRHEAGEDPHGRRLAGAVRAEEADDLALLHGERHVLDGRNGSVVLGEAIDLDHRSSLRSRGDAR